MEQNEALENLKSLLRLNLEKKTHLERELILAYDAEKKFSLKASLLLLESEILKIRSSILEVSKK